MKSKNSLWLETVVCSARKGVDARLERMLEARQEMRSRTEGCVSAWVSDLWMVSQCSCFRQSMMMKNLGIAVQRGVADELDSRDGGIESLLGGPPLVGIFSFDEKPRFRQVVSVA